MKTFRRPHNPYDIFRSSRTGLGLYARQKWLQEGSSPLWKADFAATVADLRSGQSDDGLWSDSPIETIHHLFGLHLTVRTSDPTIDKGLDALLVAASAPGLSGDASVVATERLRGLPFASGVRQAIILPAVLFLATIFGRTSDPIVLDGYDQIAADLTAAALDERAPATLNNILRAFVVHPDYGAHAATHVVVAWMADRQTPRGDWGPRIPFFQTLNALAHLDTPAANRQCERAFTRLVQHQEPDGGWGQTDRQWNTFLAVHALKNKGMLPATI